MIIISTTQHYNLSITDTDQESFLEWRSKINGQSNSDMIKIDSALYDISTHTLKNNTNGTLVGNSGDTPLNIQSQSSSSYVGYKNQSATILGYIGVDSDGMPAFYSSGGSKSQIPLVTNSSSGLTDSNHIAVLEDDIINWVSKTTLKNMLSVPIIQYSTTDIGEGASLASGTFYFVYE